MSLADAAWRRSTRSGSNGGTCVEAAASGPRVAIRDSKDPSGPVLAVTPAAWAAFTRTVRTR